MRKPSEIAANIIATAEHCESNSRTRRILAHEMQCAKAEVDRLARATDTANREWAILDRRNTSLFHEMSQCLTEEG
jgi:uncharacterized tellurite resistance protein B-like protein